MELQITVDPRATSGKANKGLRRGGVVPGVLFGKLAGSVPVQLDEKAFEELYHQAGRTSIVNLSVGDAAPTSVIIKSVQRHPLSGRALHVDFFAVNLAQEMQADIPLVFTGTPPAIDLLEGTFFANLDHLKVRALPRDLPHELSVDISGLVDFDAAIHVSDVVVVGAVTVLNTPDELVAKVVPPRKVEEEIPVAVEGEEGAEGEEGVEGEAAEGDEGAEGEAAARRESEDEA